MKGRLLLGAAAFAMLVVVGGAYLSTPPSSSSAPVPAITTRTPATPAPTALALAGGYTLSQVATHNSQTNCWSAINSKVYNLTSWINRHPGGAQAIFSLCGTDGSAAFNAQHGGARRPAQELAGFLLGTLTQ